MTLSTHTASVLNDVAFPERFETEQALDDYLALPSYMDTPGLPSAQFMKAKR